jgi:hypothetical protein
LKKHSGVCDYASSNSLLGQGDAVTCSYTFEELKSRKFSGDWSAFLTWWKANKDAEHKKLVAQK